MTIRTEDRERLKKQAVIIRGPDGVSYSCDRCAFTRTYGTEQGAINGAADHLATAHKARLTLAGCGL